MNTADQHTHTFADEPGDPSQPTAERAPETAPSEPMPVTNDFDAGSDQPPPIPQDALAAESAWSLDAQPSATEPAIAPADGGDAGREGDASVLKAGGRGPRRSRGGKDRDRGPGTSQALSDRPARRSPTPRVSNQQRELIVNYVPGEECRVAVIVDGKLDEFYSERNDAVSHVGNIYVGRVTNVEPSIQAAFVDFGLQHAGFLHTSDVHPRYFPGERGDTTERIGKKTPRRDRPPIQECFRRGDEVIVQVLKEGVGSKGPTVTSYLSIPGRYLVMMPGMDRVGVSRKVEDEDLRDKMKAILDQLELPEGFGFIVRTAGLDKTKTELKRDLSYLMRLQKDMERRKKAGNKPRLLYSESDLLVRTLRDMSSTETDKIMIDSELGLQRAARFLKIVSPRSATKLFHYTGKTPIFHATGIESQIKNIYTREVPLPSGGRLVIDETEALVAIDVNSGRARDASDSETNALRTNLEAIDEIARQLRLRDLGGIVINDLIDMRAARHRHEVEDKFLEIMSTDRARSTILPISEFGVIEMTRQRMRGSHESIHFHDCPTCNGRGLIQRAESVAADALREAAALLDHERVVRVEIVVHARVAAELLSSRRTQLYRLEKLMGKPIAFRLNDAIGLDRFALIGFDQQGHELDPSRVPRQRLTEALVKAWEDNDPSVDADAPEELFVFNEAPDDEFDDDLAPRDPLLDDAQPAVQSEDGANFTIETAPRGRGRDRSRGGRSGPAGGGRQGEDFVPPHPNPAAQSVRPAYVAPARITGPRLVLEQAPPEAIGTGQPTIGPDGQPLPANAPGSAGPHGQAAGTDGPGEGGRRRRRRRGRGRGQGPLLGPDGQPLPAEESGELDAADGPARSSGFAHEDDGFDRPRVLIDDDLPPGMTARSPVKAVSMGPSTLATVRPPEAVTPEIEAQLDAILGFRVPITEPVQVTGGSEGARNAMSASGAIDADAEVPGDDGPDSDEPGDGQGEGPAGQGGRKRKRRRRRGGRGGAGPQAGAADGPDAGAGQAPVQQAPVQQAAGPQVVVPRPAAAVGVGSKSESAPSRASSPAPASTAAIAPAKPAATPPPTPAATPAASTAATPSSGPAAKPAASKPRTLYGGAIRRLKPGERRPGPKRED